MRRWRQEQRGADKYLSSVPVACFKRCFATRTPREKPVTFCPFPHMESFMCTFRKVQGGFYFLVFSQGTKNRMSPSTQARAYSGICYLSVRLTDAPCCIQSLYDFSEAEKKQLPLTDGGISQLQFSWSDAPHHFSWITAEDSGWRNVKEETRENILPCWHIMVYILWRLWY